MKKHEQTFIISYPFEGSEWTVKIHATSFEEAEKRLAAMQNFAKVDGQLMLSISVFPGSWLLVGLICWWKNRRRDEVVGGWK